MFASILHRQLLQQPSSKCMFLKQYAQRRTLATRRVWKKGNIPLDVIQNQMPCYLDADADERAAAALPHQSNGDKTVFPDTPITSAHCIDTIKQEVSILDSVIVSPDGATIVHGRYGPLPGTVAAAIPLEYLALLRPAAEGAAALRVLSGGKTNSKGTLLVYGASQATGIALTQLASHQGHAVVGVVDGTHSGNTDMVECIKGLIAEPGTVVPEEYALSKKLFMELVHSISTGDEGIINSTPETYLKQFKSNFFEYCEYYPDTRPAAVSEDVIKFQYMEKDREHWDENMRTYLEQYPPGSPKMDPEKVQNKFDVLQYDLFRNKFWTQTTDVISGGEEPFSAPHIVKQMSETPESENDHPYRTYHGGAGPYFPYNFSILNQSFPDNTTVPAGGPIMGTAIVMTDHLQSALQKMSKAKPTLRSMGETLQFLSKNERAAYSVARTMITMATSVKAPVVVLNGTIAPYETIQATDTDVQTALHAMDIPEDGGNSILNYFVQVYRANDFPFYADYAVHRAMEPLSGPRQIIVTK